MSKRVLTIVQSKVACVCSVVSDCVAPWIIACQAPHSQNPLSMGFSRQEYWSGLPFPSPEDLPYPGIKPHLLCLLHWQADSLPLVPAGINQGHWLFISTSLCIKTLHRDFPGGPLVKNSPCNAMQCSIPDQHTKIPHATEQLSFHAMMTKLTCHNQKAHVQQ